MKMLVTYNLENDNNEESETLSPLTRFNRIRKVYFLDGCLFCSSKHHQRYAIHHQRYAIDCAHIFHIITQAKEFE